MDKNGSLSRKQRRAIRALLVKPTIELAAKEAQIGATTLYTWLREDNFRQALTEAESAAIDTASRRLVGLAEKAIETIETILDNAVLHPAIRLRASELILSNMLRLVELRNIEQRLSALEEAYAQSR